MNLTGKCKEEFEKWLYNQEWYDTLVFGYNDDNMWEWITDSMQYGVYVDYFDSVGIYIDIDTEMVIGDYFEFTIDGKDGHKGNGLIFKTRQEARTKAIEKANEIHNEQLK